MNTQPLKWEVRKRLEEIERCLCWAGQLGRADLIDKFSISPQQASADIALYQTLAPGNAEFNRSFKHYAPTGAFKPQFISPDVTDYAAWNGSIDGQAVVSVLTPLRSVSPSVLKAITRSLHQKQSVLISYQSMTRARPTRRRITPHSIVFDGYRYHVRGYCHLRESFRDFVLGRISRAGEPGEPGPSKNDDDAWNTLIILRIGPHPLLEAAQRAVIQQDFAMEQGELQLRVRQAMLLYTLTQLRLDRLADQRTPAEQQIVLLNPDVLEYE